MISQVPNFEPRTYRRLAAAPDLTAFRLVVDETDLCIQVRLGENADETAGLRHAKQLARDAILTARRQISTEIALRHEFRTSLAPLPAREGAPPVARGMYLAGQRAEVGPMAAVAGAIAEFVGRSLLECHPEVLVENGGDVFLASSQQRVIAVHAGRSALSGKVGLRVPGGEPVAVCTSSATVGPSYSAGNADAALIAAAEGAFADAMASALGNRIRSPQDVEPAVIWACGVPGVVQALVMIGDVLGVKGAFEITRL